MMKKLRLLSCTCLDIKRKTSNFNLSSCNRIRDFILTKFSPRKCAKKFLRKCAKKRCFFTQQSCFFIEYFTIFASGRRFTTISGWSAGQVCLCVCVCVCVCGGGGGVSCTDLTRPLKSWLNWRHLSQIMCFPKRVFQKCN